MFSGAVSAGSVACGGEVAGGSVDSGVVGAVVAALYPDEQYVAQKYLYFCSKDPDSGELYFSRTLKEHEAAVAMYRPLWEEYDKKRGLSN